MDRIVLVLNVLSLSEAPKAQTCPYAHVRGQPSLRYSRERSNTFPLPQKGEGTKLQVCASNCSHGKCGKGQRSRILKTGA